LKGIRISCRKIDFLTEGETLLLLCIGPGEATWNEKQIEKLSENEEVLESKSE